MEKPEREEIDAEGDDNYNPEEEVLDGNWKQIDLPDTEAKSGEEETEEIFNVRAKLYRWRDEQWKERGVGQAKVLKHKESGRYNFMLRQESTLKIMAFTYITGANLCQLQKLETADKSLFWSCIDASDGAPKLEKFCLRVKTGEELVQFKAAFELAYKENGKLEWGKKSEPKKEETKVDEKKEEKKEEKQEDSKKD